MVVDICFSRPAVGAIGRLWLVAMFGAFTWTACSLQVATAEPAAKEIALFNGRDLAGWQAEGGARWEVQDGVLVGRQGPENQPGDLLTRDEFGDFELTVVYRMQKPGNSGVWYRYQSADKAYQADILEYVNPLAYSGSLYCTGKMFLARNTDPKLERADDWNTLVMRIEGDRHIITLNGTVVADVRDPLCSRGRIGFQVHAGREFAPMRLYVREVKLRPL